MAGGEFVTAEDNTPDRPKGGGGGGETPRNLWFNVKKNSYGTETQSDLKVISGDSFQFIRGHSSTATSKWMEYFYQVKKFATIAICLCTLVVYIVNNMDPDQTAHLSQIRVHTVLFHAKSILECF